MGDFFVSGLKIPLSLTFEIAFPGNQGVKTQAFTVMPVVFKFSLKK
jgi:hypothetical protein